MPNGPIIIKKVSGHGGHHGGAWKVAYADFVTAMMALFIVLWLLNSSKQVQEAVGGYFKDPSGNSKKVGSAMRGSGQNLDLRKEDMKKIKDALQKQIKALPDFEKMKKHIDMTITAEGSAHRVDGGRQAVRFSSPAARCQVPAARSCWRRWHRRSAGFPIMFPSRGTPTQSPIRAGSADTATGSFPWIAPTRRARSCRALGCRRTRSRRYGGLPINARASTVESDDPGQSENLADRAIR